MSGEERIRLMNGRRQQWTGTRREYELERESLEAQGFQLVEEDDVLDDPADDPLEPKSSTDE